MILDEMSEILKEVGGLQDLFADQSYSLEDMYEMSKLGREASWEEIDRMRRMHTDGTSFTEEEIAYMYSCVFISSLFDEYCIEMELCGCTNTKGFSLEKKYVTFARLYAKDRVASIVDSISRCC